MTVVYKAGEQTFKAVEVLWGKRELINAIVEAALISQTEGFIEMIVDGEGPNEITRASVNETLKGVKDSAQDFINDMLGDLAYQLNARLASVNYGAAVTGIKYDLAGDVTDIEVNVSVGVE